MGGLCYIRSTLFYVETQFLLSNSTVLEKSFEFSSKQDAFSILHQLHAILFEQQQKVVVVPPIAADLQGEECPVESDSESEGSSDESSEEE